MRPRYTPLILNLNGAMTGVSSKWQQSPRVTRKDFKKRGTISRDLSIFAEVQHLNVLKQVKYETGKT